MFAALSRAAAASTRSAPVRFAGHSKWAKIARGKGATDAARSTLFAKLGRALGAAVRAGGADPSSNLRLGSLLEAARRASMPKDNVERAMKMRDEGAALAEVTFEVAAPGGAALLVDVLTDNIKRTAPAIRHIVSKHGGEVAAPGAQSWLFATRGRVVVARGTPADDERVLDAALGAGAVDVDFDGADDGGDGDGDGAAGGDAVVVITTARETLAAVRGAVAAAGAKVLGASLGRVPSTTVALEGADAEAFGALLAALDEHEDVQAVTHNAEDGEE